MLNVTLKLSQMSIEIPLFYSRPISTSCFPSPLPKFRDGGMEGRRKTRGKENVGRRGKKREREWGGLTEKSEWEGENKEVAATVNTRCVFACLTRCYFSIEGRFSTAGHFRLSEDTTVCLLQNIYCVSSYCWQAKGRVLHPTRGQTEMYKIWICSDPIKSSFECPYSGASCTSEPQTTSQTRSRLLDTLWFGLGEAWCLGRVCKRSPTEIPVFFLCCQFLIWS